MFSNIFECNLRADDFFLICFIFSFIDPQICLNLFDIWKEIMNYFSYNQKSFINKFIYFEVENILNILSKMFPK